MQIASIETAPRSEMSTRYGDLSDLLAPETDRSLDPVLASATDSTLTIATGRVPKGGTLAGALRGSGVSPILVDQIARGLRPVFDFRRARPGALASPVLLQGPEPAPVGLTLAGHGGRRLGSRARDHHE